MSRRIFKSIKYFKLHNILVFYVEYIFESDTPDIPGGYKTVILNVTCSVYGYLSSFM